MGKYPIHFKVWSQMIKYFVRLAQGTRNIIVNDAFACAIAQNTRWIQTVMRLLKVNGFYFLYPHDINKDSLKKQFMKRCQDNYLQELRFSEGTKINEYLNLQENENYQYQSYLEKIRIVEHKNSYKTEGRQYLFECRERQTPKPFTRDACLSGMRKRHRRLKHFFLGCKKPSEKRTQFIVRLNNVTNNIFDFLTTDTKVRKIVNLDFEDQRKINMVGKALFDLYRERERMEEIGNQDVRTTHEPYDPNVGTG